MNLYISFKDNESINIMNNIQGLDLQIKDNFFSKKEYEILVNNLDKILFTPRKNDNGIYSFSYSFDPTEENQWIFDKIKKYFFPNNNELKIISSGYSLRDNKNIMSPHIDKDTICSDEVYKNKYNCLIYLKGKELLYNGTGFYHKENLNTYIGFVENRAIFFNGCDIYHSCLQGLGESSSRYSLGIFYGVKR
jgi:hypothetical protein